MLSEEDAGPLSASASRSLYLHEHACAVSSPWLFLASSSHCNVLRVGLVLTAAWWEDTALRPRGPAVYKLPTHPPLRSLATHQRIVLPLSAEWWAPPLETHAIGFVIQNPFSLDLQENLMFESYSCYSNKQLKLVVIYFHASLTLQKL